MKSVCVAILSLLSVASAARTYNKPAAFAPGQFEKYKCLDTKSWLPQVPECLHQCTIDANKDDDCAYDDFACHCINYQTYSDLIEPCVFPPELGGHGSCTLQDLGVARPIVNDMCNFFNATLYADYVGCPNRLSILKTLKTVASEETIVVE